MGGLGWRGVRGVIVERGEGCECEEVMVQV